MESAAGQHQGSPTQGSPLTQHKERTPGSLLRALAHAKSQITSKSPGVQAAACCACHTVGTK